VLAGGIGAAVSFSGPSFRSLRSFGSLEPATQWRVASVSGRPDAPAVGEVVRPGEAIRTANEQGIAIVSEAGDRILLREDGVLRLAGGGTQFILQEGAAVVSVQRGVCIKTPHGDLALSPGNRGVDGDEPGRGQCFLMIAESTNSFTRVDVVSGCASMSAVVGDDPGAPLRVAPGRAACMRAGVEPSVFESDGWEMSPAYGGLFARDYLEALENNTNAYLSWFAAGDMLWELSADRLEGRMAWLPDRAKGAEPRRKGPEWFVKAPENKETGALGIAFDPIPEEGGVIELTARFWPAGRGVIVGLRLRTEGSDGLGSPLEPEGLAREKLKTPSSFARVTSGLPLRLKCAFARVGSNTDGEPVYCMIGLIAAGHRASGMSGCFEQGRPVAIAVELCDATIALQSVRAMALGSPAVAVDRAGGDPQGGPEDRH